MRECLHILTTYCNFYKVYYKGYKNTTIFSITTCMPIFTSLQLIMFCMPVHHIVQSSENKCVFVRMSVFFFRLHNLRREEENKRRRHKSGTGCGMLRSNLTLAPSRLFERTPLTPSDSLDEIAFKIPRSVCQ